jgi:hypothetical protein
MESGSLVTPKVKPWCANKAWNCNKMIIDCDSVSWKVMINSSFLSVGDYNTDCILFFVNIII